MRLFAVDWSAMLKKSAPYSVAACMALLVYLYAFNGNMERLDVYSPSAIKWMAHRWSGDMAAADLSFGWMIPLVSLYSVWLRRQSIREAPLYSDWRGLVLILCAVLLYWMGIQGRQTRLTLFSMILMLWSIPLAYWGWNVARQLIFPCAYLIFCIPLNFLDSMTFPLRLFASTVSSGILNGLGVMTVRTGTAMHSAIAGGFHFEVADPCSGLRSVLAMTALTAAYAHFTQRGRWRQGLLFLAAFPLAVAGNIVRIVMIGLVALVFGQENALRFYEQSSGYFFFGAATALMLLTANLLNHDWKSTWSNALSRFRA